MSVSNLVRDSGFRRYGASLRMASRMVSLQAMTRRFCRDFHQRRAFGTVGWNRYRMRRLFFNISSSGVRVVADDPAPPPPLDILTAAAVVVVGVEATSLVGC